MKKFGLVMAMFIGVSWGIYPAIAQMSLEADTLKMSPARYKNSFVKVQDIYQHIRAGIPLTLTKAGYTLDKYLTFGAAKTGMRCFMRRDSVSEQAVAELKNGDRITICGYVKQPKATVAEDTRFKHKEKLDIYIIEVNKVTKGWE